MEYLDLWFNIILIYQPDWTDIWEARLDVLEWPEPECDFVPAPLRQLSDLVSHSINLIWSIGGVINNTNGIIDYKPVCLLQFLQQLEFRHGQLLWATIQTTITLLSNSTRFLLNHTRAQISVNHFLVRCSRLVFHEKSCRLLGDNSLEE